MSIQYAGLGVALVLLPVTTVWAASRAEKVRNERVLVVEESLTPGEAEAMAGDHPGVAVYLDAGTIEFTPVEGHPRRDAVKRGDVVLQPPLAGTLKNVGVSVLRIVRIEYLAGGTAEEWGTAGLAPHYRLLFENRYGRVYGIRIPAGTSEPLHSHHDRVVVCLSGAELRHEMPDGRSETSTLQTGEIAWRRGGTHVGHNIGTTDLWVIAIEPK